MEVPESDEREVRLELLRWVTPDETGEDLAQRLARTNINLTTSLPFLDDLEWHNGKHQGYVDLELERQTRRRRRRVKIRAGQVLEICGGHATCKTECLLQAAATCILPQACGGCGRPALLIANLSGFDPLRLVHILDTRIRKSKNAGLGHAMLEESLKRFQLTRCYNNTDILLALNQFGASGCADLLLIDNISAFYPQKTISSQSEVYEAMGRCLQRLGVAVLVTKDMSTALPKAWQQAVTYRVLLDANRNRKNTFTAKWDIPKLEKTFEFRVTDSHVCLL